MISKSAFLAGLQCENLIWTRFNAHDLIPPHDSSLEAIDNLGREVGVLDALSRWDRSRCRHCGP